MDGFAYMKQVDITDVVDIKLQMADLNVCQVYELCPYGGALTEEIQKEIFTF